MLIGEKAFAIEKVPAFTDFIGYMYFCGGTIAGPFYEFRDYINFIEKKDTYKQIPNTIVPTLLKFSTALCNI